MFSCKSPFCYCASEWSADVTGDGWHEGCLCSSDQKRIVPASLFISALGERQLNARSLTANDHTSVKTCTCVANCWKISASQLDLPVLKLSPEHGSRLHANVPIFTRTCTGMHICRYMFIQKCPGTGLLWNPERLCLCLTAWYLSALYELLPLLCQALWNSQDRHNHGDLYLQSRKKPSLLLR